MEEYLQKLSAYIAEHPPDIHSDGGDTILDALFWTYCESAGGDSEGVQQAYDSLHNQLQGLQPQHADAILDTVSDLCWEHDRLGFINGFRMGMCLEQELSQ